MALPVIGELDRCIDRLRSSSTEIEIVWTTEDWKSSLTDGNLSISILDSSFNPPTLAHFALALLPPSGSTRSSLVPQAPHEQPRFGYLLMLSVRNADKQLKPGDATLAQRLQMMVLMAKEMQSHIDPSRLGGCPIAVAAIDEPTFVGKSLKLHRYLNSVIGNTIPDARTFRFAFIIGYDTIIRLFDSKYYGSHDAMVTSLGSFFHVDHSSILCARRNLPSTTASPDHTSNPFDEEAAFLESEDVREFAISGSVKMVEIDPSDGALSSTLLRSTVAEEGASSSSSSNERSWREMVLPPIAEYIVSNKLYSAAAT